MRQAEYNTDDYNRKPGNFSRTGKKILQTTPEQSFFA